MTEAEMPAIAERLRREQDQDLLEIRLIARGLALSEVLAGIHWTLLFGRHDDAVALERFCRVLAFAQIAKL